MVRAGAGPLRYGGWARPIRQHQGPYGTGESIQETCYVVVAVVGRWRKRSLCCLIASFEKNKYLDGMATYSANLTSNKANEYAYR